MMRQIVDERITLNSFFPIDGTGCFLLGPPEEKNLFEAGPIKNLYKKTPWRVMKSLDLLYSKFFCYLHANVEVSLNGMRVEIPHMYKV